MPTTKLNYEAQKLIETEKKIKDVEKQRAREIEIQILRENEEIKTKEEEFKLKEEDFQI